MSDEQLETLERDERAQAELEGAVEIPDPLEGDVDELEAAGDDEGDELEDESGDEDELAGEDPAASQIEDLENRLLAAEGLAGRPIAGRPSTVLLEQALVMFDLEPTHVVGWCGYPKTDHGPAHVTVVTAGGRRLTYPGDDLGGGRLSQHEKDGVPVSVPAGVYKKPAGA